MLKAGASDQLGSKLPKATTLTFHTPERSESHSCLLRLATTCDTAYFGGIVMSMCTGSPINYPGSLSHSFCHANSRHIFPKCGRNSPSSTFRRYFVMKTTWDMHAHFV